MICVMAFEFIVDGVGVGGGVGGGGRCRHSTFCTTRFCLCRFRSQ